MRPSRRAVLAAGLAMAATPAKALAPRYPWQLAVQLWSVDAELRHDFAGTLRALAALGFRSVEAAGWHGRSPAAFAAGLRAAGLRCDSAHIPFAKLAGDAEGALAEARDAGARWVVCPSPEPSTPPAPGGDWNAELARAMTPDDWRRTADVLDRAGEIARRRGLRVAYHNHAAEFVERDGRTGFDLLLQGTAPDRVALELDIGWAAVAGRDPAALLARQAARIRLLHIKDARRLDDGRWVTAPAGSGVVDWPAVLTAARRARIAHAFVEVEQPLTRRPLEALRSVAAFLATPGSPIRPKLP